MKARKTINRVLFVCLIITGSSFSPVHAQKKSNPKVNKQLMIPSPGEWIKYGVASYYAAKFDGRKTASGEIYRNELSTAACNILPFNTWIKVTNLKNNKFIIAKINDRLHSKNKRLIDLSKSAAKKLGYISVGLTKVRVEVLEDYDPSESISRD